MNPSSLCDLKSNYQSKFDNYNSKFTNLVKYWNLRYREMANSCIVEKNKLQGMFRAGRTSQRISTMLKYNSNWWTCNIISINFYIILTQTYCRQHDFKSIIAMEIFGCSIGRRNGCRLASTKQCKEPKEGCRPDPRVHVVGVDSGRCKESRLTGDFRRIPRPSCW